MSIAEQNLLDVRRFSTDLQSIELPDTGRFLGSRRSSSLRPDFDGSRRNSNHNAEKEGGAQGMELKTLPEDPGNIEKRLVSNQPFKIKYIYNAPQEFDQIRNQFLKTHFENLLFNDSFRLKLIFASEVE